MDPRLELRLRLVLSFYELGNFRTARSEQHPIIALSLFSDGSNAVGPNTELRRVLEIMLVVCPLLYYFV